MSAILLSLNWNRMCTTIKAMKISTIFESNVKLTQQSRINSKDSSE